nr:hypothetical protein [Serratia marcescens]
MQDKSKVFNVFKLWKAKVEMESGCKIKAFRSDNGGEYTSNAFEEFLKVHGIRAIRTVPKTPQENGISERMNRTLLERARCMRLHAGLPLRWWMTAVTTAAYLINRSPSSALEGGIPEEMWSGKRVNYAYLKVYGCIAYSLIDPADRKKLDAKS